MRIENLLATFPKLVGADKQHNTVETAEVRYVYQPIENLMVLLMTNKLSNIVADLELLRLFAKVLTEYCPGEIDEANVCKHAFELVFAFDEVVAMGHKENVTMRDIQINIEMESHEEKLSIMIRQSKEREANQKAKEREKEIARNKGGGMGGKMPGGISSMPEASLGPVTIPSGTGIDTSMGMSGMGQGMGMDRPPTYQKPLAKGVGMALGKKKGPAGASLLQQLVDTGEVDDAPHMPGKPTAAATGGSAPANRVMSDAIQLTVDEKVVVQMNRDGGLEQMEVKGDLTLLITDAAMGKVTVPLRMGENPGFQFKQHPNINKQLFTAESTLGLKDPSKAFPTGSALGVLKWRLATTDEGHVPLLINCWPTQESGGFTVNVEYELQQSRMELRDVHITIPVPAADAPVITDGEGASFNKRESLLTWVIPVIDSANGSGSIEFTAAVDSPDAFFPIDVRFHSQKTFCEMEVPTVLSAEDGSALPFGKVGGLSVESYRVN
mmetsp:Transcript_15183/g.30722  ORF Transcript_15183/g.30722 Transcript_15183/m.30722 type:complete len:496 (+) Transcript_15183:15-1502(+)